MKQLKLTLCIAVLLLVCACENRSQNTTVGSSLESTPPTSISSETSATASSSSLLERVSNSSSEADVGLKNGTDGGSAETDSARALYNAYFAKEVQWQGADLSGDEQYQLGSDAPYDTAEIRFSFSVTAEGTVQRLLLQRDAELGNWRHQSEESLPAALTGISEAVTPYNLPSAASEGKLFLIQNQTTLIQTDENGENLVVLYESSGMLSKLTAGEDIVFFIENEDTLCRLHLASSIVDKMSLPDMSFSRYMPISNFVVQVYGEANDSYLLDFQTKNSRPVTDADVDEMGRLHYEIKQ